jgi:cytochrome c-type biogenesis protein CcmH/NrfF
MNRRAIFVLLAIAIAAWANPANGDPRKERLYSMFIAPCCWRENLLAHHSPKADDLRREIDALVAAGRSDEEIKTDFVGRYSLRILALPEGARGQFLAWATPVVLLFGACAVVLFIRRSVRITPTTAARPGPLPDIPESEWL